MIAVLSAAVPPAGETPVGSARPPHQGSFHEFLSALNPLQYVPVVGTIYRAVTGDTIPEPMRRIGSFIVSALTGGPIGIAINLGILAAEKATDVDLENTAQALLHGGQAPPAGATVAADPLAAPSVVRNAAAPEPVIRPWSPAQLAAYGVTAGDGALRKDGLAGADVLNALELSQIQTAHLAYARAMAADA